METSSSSPDCGTTTSASSGIHSDDLPQPMEESEAGSGASSLAGSEGVIETVSAINPAVKREGNGEEEEDDEDDDVEERHRRRRIRRRRRRRRSQHLKHSTNENEEEEEEEGSDNDDDEDSEEGPERLSATSASDGGFVSSPGLSRGR